MAAIAPAAMRTCRSSDMRGAPRRTGWPAAVHAAMPPSSTCRLAMPAALSASSALRARWPDRQTRTTGSATPARISGPCSPSVSSGTL